MLVICGTNENENIRLGGVRLGFDVFLFIFAPEMSIIFGIRTINKIIINKIYACNGTRTPSKINQNMQYHVIKNATKQTSGVQPGWDGGWGLWNPATW